MSVCLSVLCQVCLVENICRRKERSVFRQMLPLVRVCEHRCRIYRGHLVYNRRRSLSVDPENSFPPSVANASLAVTLVLYRVSAFHDSPSLFSKWPWSRDKKFFYLQFSRPEASKMDIPILPKIISLFPLKRPFSPKKIVEKRMARALSLPAREIEYSHSKRPETGLTSD